MKKVLIIDISSYKAIVLARAFAKIEDVELFTADHRPFTKRFRSRWAGQHFICPNSQKSPEAFFSFIKKLVDKHAIDVLLPVNSNDIRILLENRKPLSPALDYMCDIETFKRLDNKASFAKFASESGLRIPKSYSLTDKKIDLPVVFKPTESSSSKGVKYIRDIPALEALKSTNPSEGDYVLQEFIEGSGVGYSVFCRNGQILAGCGHKRLAEIPISGGSSTIRGYFEHPSMYEMAQKVVKTLNFSGFAMFEFKLTKHNEAVLIEVNPRIWGSINQSIQSGVNFAGLLVHPERPMGELKKSTITYISPLHILSILKYILKKGDFTAFKLFSANYFRAKSDVPFFSDPLGYLSMLMRAIG